jgi:integrase
VPRKKGHNGRGSIFQREDNGLWVASVVLGRGANGRVKRKSVSSRSKEECLRKLRRLELEIEAGKYAGSEMRFSDRCEDWLSEMKHQVKRRTLKVYRDELAHACRVFGNKPLTDVTAASIRTMQRQLAEQIGAPTAKKVRDRVSAVLEAAFRDEEVPRNVAKHVKAVKQTKYPVIIWSSEEIDLFLNHHRDHRLYGLFYFYLATGARRSEALALKWDKIDFRSREVHIHETITITEKGPDYGLPKTLAGYRTVPAGAELFEVLLEHRERQKAEKAACGHWQENNLVFPAMTGLMLRSLDKSWGRMKRWATEEGLRRNPPVKLQDVRIHDLRHTFVSMCVATGMDVVRIAEIIGHSDPSFTYKTYAHVFKKYQRFSVPDLSTLKGQQEAADEALEDDDEAEDAA